MRRESHCWRELNRANWDERTVPWRMFQMLVRKDDGDWHWPDKPRLPLSLSRQATRR